MLCVKIFVHMLMPVEFTPREEALNDHQGKKMGEWTLAMSMSVMRRGGQERGHAWALQHGRPLPKADFHHCQLFSLLLQEIHAKILQWPYPSRRPTGHLMVTWLLS